MKIIGGLAEGQVLQRLDRAGATVSLVVADAPAGPVTVTISGPRGALKGWKDRVIATTKGGGFKAKLNGLPAGGPYRLELRARKNVVRLRSFYVGDVWLLAGQSNMQGYAEMTGQATPDSRVRVFSMRREWRLAADPLHVLEESPDVCHTAQQCTPDEGESLRRNATVGVGAGIFFAKEMLRRSNVPQGLICAAHGGTTMKQWDPSLREQGGGSLYGSMLLSARATGQPVAGILWYQGEGDTHENDPAHYTTRMIQLVATTRSDLGQPTLPWVIVQIARIFFDGNSPALWNNVQEQQRLLPEKISNLETVASIDLPLDDLVHVGAAGFPRLGTRLARAANRLVYKNKSEKRPPQLDSITPHLLRRKGVPPIPVIDVKFDHVGGDLKCADEPQGFTLLNDELQPVTAIFRTTLHGSIVRLHLISHPETWSAAVKPSLSYGHGRAPRCNITDGRDFSLPVFGPLAIPGFQALVPAGTK